MKLSKEVVQRRLDLMAEEGVTFRPGVNVGKDMAWDDIVSDHDAILMATGATWPRDLPIPGRKEAKTGIHFAMEFLQTWQQKQRGKVRCCFFPDVVRKQNTIFDKHSYTEDTQIYTNGCVP